MTGDLSNICKGHEKSGHNITADVSRVIFPFFYFKYLNAYLPCFKIKDFACEVTLGCIRFIIYHGIHFLYHRDPSCNANQARLIICKNTRVQTIVSIKRKPVLCYVSLKNWINLKILRILHFLFLLSSRCFHVSSTLIKGKIIYTISQWPEEP